MKSAAEKLKDVKLTKAISPDAGYIKFIGIDRYDNRVDSDDRIQLQFNVDVDTNIVDETVPCIEGDFKTIPRLSHIINNIAFIETGVTKTGYYINILCNPEETVIGYKNGLLIQASYDLDFLPKKHQLVIQYDRNKHFNPLYQTTIIALLKGAKKIGLSPIIETGDVDKFKIKKLPREISLESLYKFLPVELIN